RDLKGVGRVYQQTFLDTHTKLAFAKLYDRKTPLVAAGVQIRPALPASLICARRSRASQNRRILADFSVRTGSLPASPFEKTARKGPPLLARLGRRPLQVSITRLA